MRTIPALLLSAAWALLQLPATLRAAAPPSQDPFPPGIFGIGSCHVNNRSAQDAARWVPQMEAIGLHSYRSGATGWGQVEPAPGQWDWAALDEQLSYLEAHGFVSGGLLLGNPAWNTRDAPGSLPVNNLPAWSAYVSALVRHAGGRIKRWEVWNEPPNFTGPQQTPADYARIVVSAYAAAKAADPSCLVGLAAKSAHVNYLEQVIRAGARDHFDFITLHPYEILDGIASDAGTEAVFLNIVPVLRRMLQAQNPAKRDVPVLFTELGCDARKGEDKQAHALVKAYAMGIAQGVACIHWFEGRDGDSGPLGLLDRQGKPRPSYAALGQLIRHLGQRPAFLGWVLLQDKHCGFLFQGAEAEVLIAWAYRGEPARVPSSRPLQVLDPLSGQVQSTGSLALASAPVLVLGGIPEEWRCQARANRDRPLSWGGDFSRAASVSITPGAAGGEKGLHTRSGRDVAHAVQAYGGPARAGNLPGGNLFIVDPSFLSYSSVPLEITAVVRRNEANENAGFKLVYESRDGFKTAPGGWFTIPGNQAWHTVRWQIDDPQFVNYWGYNFALVSDGDRYNRYYLQSVTVTKRAAPPHPP